MVRNRGQHGGDLTSFRVPYDQRTLDKHPRPFFMNERERESWMENGEAAAPWLLAPNVEVTREALFVAIEHVERLADFIERRTEKAAEWRMGKR